MSRKYRITDEDGCKYSVEEIETKDEDIIEETEEMQKDEDVIALSEDEIVALRKLIPFADKLVALVDVQEEVGDEEEEEEIVDEEEIKEEEVLDTDEEEEEGAKPRDSKKSIGALEKKRKFVDDSLVDDVANAWAKRYGGKN